MKRTFLLLGSAALCTAVGLGPLRAEMTSGEKAAAALAILGVVALAHNKHHYPNGYAPTGGDQIADFERGYRDALHGYTYDTRHSTRDYATGYEAGLGERENSLAHRQIAASGQKAPPMALSGCAQVVAKNSQWGRAAFISSSRASCTPCAADRPLPRFPIRACWATAT